MSFLTAEAQSEPFAKNVSQNVYAECEQLLVSEKLNQLSQHVADGWGSRIDDSELGKPLIGVECSDNQIIDFMEHHGFTYGQTRTWAEPQDYHPFGRYDKLINFSTRRTNRFYRWLYGEWAVGARFMMLNDTIVRISSAAHK